MTNVIEFLSQPSILTVLGLIVGFLLKKATWFNTKAIPVINFLIAVLIHAGAAITGVPRTSLIPDVLIAGVVFAGLPPFMSIFWDAFLQAALTTGIHSMAKNTKQAIK